MTRYLGLYALVMQNPCAPNMVLIKDLQDSVSVFVTPIPQSQKLKILNCLDNYRNYLLSSNIKNTKHIDTFCVKNTQRNRYLFLLQGLESHSRHLDIHPPIILVRKEGLSRSEF